MGCLPTFTGVRFPTDAIHRDGKCFVGLGRDRPVGHCASGESFHDLFGRLDLGERDWGDVFGLEPEQASQRGQVFCRVVDRVGVLLEDFVLTLAGRMLQPKYGLRVKQVVFAFATPLVFAADLKIAVGPF